MSAFQKRLQSLCDLARTEGILNDEQAQRLCDLSDRQGSRKLDASAVLLGLGGLIVITGCILLIAANWQALSPVIKFTLFFLLFAGCHGCGFWLRMRTNPMPRAADVLHFIGMGLFLGGIGLVAQVYHLDDHAPNAIFLWFGATLPLALLLRSPSLTGMATLAFLIWLHMEGSADDSPLKQPHSFTTWAATESGVGISLIVLAQLLEQRRYATAMTLRVFGMTLFLPALYALTFFRHYGTPDHRYADLHQHPSLAGLIFPASTCAAALLLVLLLWICAMRHPHPGWRSQAALYFLSLVTVVYAASTALGLLAPGETIRASFLHGEYPVASLIVTAAAWLLWFWGCFWLILDGSRLGRKGTIGLGTTGIVAGIITAFFDLIGTQSATGILFFLAGLALLAITGWSIRRWKKQNKPAPAGDSAQP